MGKNDIDERKLNNEVVSVNHKVEMLIPRKSEYLSVVRLFIAGIANLLRLNSEEIDDLRLAVSEACFGAMRGDNHENNGGIRIRCHLKEERLRIDVQFGMVMPLRSLSSREPEDEALGLLLMRNLMDKVEYRVDEKGTEIRLVKFVRLHNNIVQ